MFKKLFSRYSRLSSTSRYMLNIFWLFNLSRIVSLFFVNMYLYQFTQEIVDNILYTMYMFSATWIWFLLIGYGSSRTHLDLRKLVKLAFILFGLAYWVLILFPWHWSIVYVFGILSGFAQAAYWTWYHTFELTYLKDKDKPFYSWIIGTGSALLWVIWPIVMTWLLYVNTFIMPAFPYFLIFLVMMLLFFTGIGYIGNLPKLDTPKIRKKDIRTFFNIKKHKYALWYFWSTWITSWLNFLITLLGLIILWSDIDMWVLISFKWLVSTLVLLYISSFLKNSNKMGLFAKALTVLCICYIWISFILEPVVYIVLSLLMSIVLRISRVVIMTNDLIYMKKMHGKKHNVFTPILARETVLFASRFIVLSILLWMTFFLLNLLVIQFGIIVMALWYVSIRYLSTKEEEEILLKKKK